jgi:hypothetical protein
MSTPYLRFTGGALRVRSVQRVEFQEPVSVRPAVNVQATEVPVAAPEPVPAPAPEPEPVQVAEVPVAEPESNVEAPAEVAEAAPESGLVPEDPPA